MFLSSAPKPLTRSEKLILEKYFVFARPLESGQRPPRNEKEKYFLKVCQGLVLPRTAFQKVYLQYMKIRDYDKMRKGVHNYLDTTNTSKANNNHHNASRKADTRLKTDEDIAIEKRKEENAEALLRMHKRADSKEIYIPGTNIPEYEEGMPRSEFGTREDHKKMRSRDWGDMVRRQR